ncbi:hypothetical protein BDP27DRAFT_1368354 [Rhodocollybia butyracea]|uniref:Uncharacterized protein n=1 Tax=Rhodocollybia butyracea TaxID=206335 RepID=A0A9P5U1K2_9AGAR|nr:hypothetical protein BDP27DRAFT_1368354 [Rhodocollybia butyracea]
MLLVHPVLKYSAEVWHQVPVKYLSKKCWLESKGRATTILPSNPADQYQIVRQGRDNMTEASTLAAEASTLAAEASTLAADASSLAIEASSLSEAATSATYLLGDHATSTANSSIFISSFTAQRAEASTSIFITDGHATTSVTPVISTSVTIVPASGKSSGPISETNTGDGKKASVERKMSEFGSDYPPRPEPFLVTSLPRPLNSTETHPSRIFSVALSADLLSNPAILGSTHQSALIVAATEGENADFDDEKADLTILDQRTSSHSVPENTALHRSSTLFSADSDPPPSYRATAIDDGV